MYRAAVRLFSTQATAPGTLRGASSLLTSRAGSNPVLAMYREMLRLAQQLTPDTKKLDALKRIREGFRTNRSVTNAVRPQWPVIHLLTLLPGRAHEAAAGRDFAAQFSARRNAPQTEVATSLRSDNHHLTQRQELRLVRD